MARVDVFPRFFGSFYKRGGLLRRASDGRGATSSGFCGVGSSRPAAAKCVRTIFRILDNLVKVKELEVASPTRGRTSATKSYGVLGENRNRRFSGEKKFFINLLTN